MLLVVLFIDAFLFLGQLAVVNMNPNSHTLDAFDSHLVKQFEKNGTTYELANADSNSLETMFPGSQEQVGSSNSGAFADIWNTVRSWIFTNTPLGVILQIIGAPYFFLKAILPGVEYQAVVFTIGAVWYAFSAFAVIAWALGRE